MITLEEVCVRVPVSHTLHNHSCPTLRRLGFAFSPGWQVAGMKRKGKPWQCMGKVGTFLPNHLERAEHLLHPPGPKLQGW